LAAAIIIKVKQEYSFRERFPEWVLSIGLTLWGITLFVTPNLFIEYDIYRPLLSFASQKVWAYLTMCIGLFRLTALVINGVWKPTSHLRALGAVGGVTIWASLVIISVLSVTEPIPAISVYGMLLAFDTMALWWAAGDAKKADIMANAEKELNVDNGK
jgi:hypothetical protein